MAQKDKVKELVGRGLGSYHTKSLQQMDRIEKKNKEQSHKISILSNELDNDYLTKTEEGSIVSLEHSKEGMVYLDELQGNTLVNYCTDGSKEITLNGDIDVEGTFVTTTEGVDNGLVDVMCEGNTLVNRIGKITSSNHSTNTSNSWNYFFTTEGRGKCTFANQLQNNTTYTVFYKITKNTLTNETNSTVLKFNLNNYNENGKGHFLITLGEVGVFKKVITTSINSTITNPYIEVSTNLTGGECEVKDIVVLEGESPYSAIEWFEGMKSVGQDDTNGHKIEILSKNKNLFNIDETDTYATSTRHEKNGNTLRIIPTSTNPWVSYNIKIRGFKNGETYALSCVSDNYHLPKSRIALYERATNTNVGSWDRNYFTIPNNVNVEDIYLRIHCCDGDVANIGEVEISDILIEKGQAKTQFVPYAINKKEILLNEPLRGLPSGTKDQMVKIGGKYYVKKKCVAITLDETYNWVFNNTDGTTTNRYILDLRPILPTLSDGQDIGNTLCDKGVTSQWSQTLELGVSRTGDSLFVYNKSCTTLVEFKNWIANNNLNLIMKLATPIYEPLGIESTLNTYNDITHISNNSIIPCNMKIKNSGYNAIIKPSTLYTVALDTNKNGTVGMNLGGAKATTTNNVLKLTTPATLTDDSLRLYGKGIKGSKVRLLEGDKTNWIPSHFEGIKSCFEDKLQDDGTYKMEILMNNKNLFDISTYYSGTANIEFKDNGFRLYTTKPMTYANALFKIKVKPFTNYKIYTDKKVVSGNTLMDVYDKSNKWLANTDTTFNSKDNMELSFRFYCSSDVSVIGDVQYSNVRLIEIGNNTDFVEHKHNKIQFSSIEPLRSVENTKDKFVFKDGKLMIERNCGAFKINSSQGFIRASKYDNGYLYGFEKDFNEIKRVLQSNKTIKCDKLPYYPYIGGDIAMKNINGEWIGTWSNKIDRSVIMLRLKTKDNTLNSLNEYLKENPIEIVYIKIEPTYEEIPFELQKIILEGYENGTLFFDTNIPPTVTTTYAGETPIVKATKLNKTEVLNNTNDINDNIVPYLMDMDYRVVCLQLQSETSGLNMTRLFGGAYEMLQRDIQSKRYSVDEYRHRLDAYLGANKITEDEYNKLGDMLND